MSKLLCIYHGHCDDGFGAAYAVRHALGDGGVEFYAGEYGKPPPDVAGRDVLLVDFSYKRPVLEEMAKTAHSILILDHHKTAQADLEDFGMGAKPDRTYQEWADLVAGAELAGYGGHPASESVLIASLFDMNRSGAGIAWDFFDPGGERPLFVDYLEDRDLWRKALPDGDEFTIALRSYPQDFDQWDELFQHYSRVAEGNVFPPALVQDLIEEGKSLERYYRLRVEEIKRTSYLADIHLVAGNGPEVHKVWIANAPYFAASEVAGELATLPGGDFGACYFEEAPGRWKYSLRSRGDFDVSAVAKAFGGGGHAAAAGFEAAEPVHKAVPSE